MKNKWLLIDSGYKTGYYNMAADEEMLSFDTPVVRIYGFKPYCITLGYSMNAAETLNFEYIHKMGFDVTRRITGGKAVLHAEEITYSLAAPLSFFGKSVVSAYEKSSLVLAYAFQQCGISVERSAELEKGESPICFAEKSKYEIGINGKKLAGFAQKKCGDKILQHCSIPLHLDLNVLLNCFIDNSTDKNGLEAKISSVNYLSQKEIGFELFKKYLINGFEEVFNIDFQKTGFSSEQEANIYNRVNRKYIMPCWVEKR